MAVSSSIEEARFAVFYSLLGPRDCVLWARAEARSPSAASSMPTVPGWSSLFLTGHRQLEYVLPPRHSFQILRLVSHHKQPMPTAPRKVPQVVCRHVRQAKTEHHYRYAAGPIS